MLLNPLTQLIGRFTDPILRSLIDLIVQAGRGGHPMVVDGLIDEKLDVGRVVAVRHCAVKHFESAAADRVDHRTSVGEEFDAADFQHGSVVGEFVRHVLKVAAHAELTRARLHGPAYHEPVARLEHVQRTLDRWEGQRANEDRNLNEAPSLTLNSILSM